MRASPAGEDADRALAAGINAYITKSIDFERLCDLMLNALSPATEQGDGGMEGPILLNWSRLSPLPPWG